MRKFFKAKVKTHILAVDLATSSISTALAIRSPRNSAGLPSDFSVIKAFCYPLNLTGFTLGTGSERLGPGGAGRPLPQIFKDAFLKVFRDARNITRHLDAVLVGLADPFFLEVKFSKQISRKDPKSKITSGEIADILRELENDARHQHNSLLPVGREISGVKINGYDVNNAEGYVGKTLEIIAVFTLATPSLRDFFNDAKEKFFPGKPIYYFSDTAILRRMVSSTALPSVIFNIDGEVTSMLYLNAGALNHIGMAPFGFSTIARRLASSFKISAEDAASLLRRYLSGALEESQAKKVGSLLESAEEDWWGWLQNYLKTLRLRALPKFILTGREQNLEQLMPFFMKNLDKFYGTNVGGEVIGQNDLAKNTGNNRFLAGLITFSSW